MPVSVDGGDGISFWMICRGRIVESVVLKALTVSIIVIRSFWSRSVGFGSSKTVFASLYTLRKVGTSNGSGVVRTAVEFKAIRSMIASCSV